jgi:hypothetical protein
MADDTNKIAEAIVNDLFTSGSGLRADRLALMKQGDRDLGGWAFKPLVDRIAKHLSCLTVSDDAGVLARARELAREAQSLERAKEAEFLKRGNKVTEDEFEKMDLAVNNAAWEVVECLSPTVPMTREQVLEHLAPQPVPSTDDHPEPTAETRGDEGFDAWWTMANHEPSWLNDNPPRILCKNAWQAAHADSYEFWSKQNHTNQEIKNQHIAELLAKVAVVRAELVKLRDKEAWRDQNSAVDHRGITVRVLNKALEIYVTAFPSDPGEVNP